jgi:hypothetical protein
MNPSSYPRHNDAWKGNARRESLQGKVCGGFDASIERIEDSVVAV